MTYAMREGKLKPFLGMPPKEKVPVRSGALRRSLSLDKIKVRKTTTRAWKVYSKGVSKGGVRYSFAIESGTSNIKAQPFLRPANDESQEKVIKKISEIIGKELDRIM